MSYDLSADTAAAATLATWATSRLEPEFVDALPPRLAAALYRTCWDGTRCLRWATLMSPEFVCGG